LEIIRPIILATSLIKGIAFMEAIIKPMAWKNFPKDFKTGIKLFCTAGIGWFMLVMTFIIYKKIIPI